MPIARLIADPLTLEMRLDRASAALSDAGMPIAVAQMLDFHGDVLQIAVPHGDPAQFRAILDAHFAPADLLVSVGDIREPQLFVSDMDSTMIGQECIDELADFAGLKEHVSAITERAMQGELDFESALKERVALLEGLDEEAIRQCLDERIAATPGARTLVATLKSRGCQTVLVTGGFHHFADPVAERLGFDRVVGNRLGIREGKLTGTLDGAIVDGSTKQRILIEEMERLGSEAVSMAAGDGANDVRMIEAATYGIAYRAKPTLRGKADGWIDRVDCTSILKLLQIPREEWVSG